MLQAQCQRINITLLFFGFTLGLLPINGLGNGPSVKSYPPIGWPGGLIQIRDAQRLLRKPGDRRRSHRSLHGI